MQTTNFRLVENMKISEIKDKIVALMPRVAYVARINGHPYKNGMMVGKNFLGLALKQLFGIKSDEKFVDHIWENGIAQVLGFKKRPNPSLFSKARKYSENGLLEVIYSELARTECNGKQLRLIAEDSKDIPVFFVIKDTDADLGVRTPKRREQEISEMTKNIPGEKRKKEVRYFIGYKVHIMSEAERGLPLTAMVLPASVHDSQPFYQLFDYTTQNFVMQIGGKFLADSAFDAATIRQRVRDKNMIDVIAINGRGHYPSETPKDRDYGNRWFLEQLNSRLDMMYNLTVHRMKGIKRVTVHVFACFIANFIEYFMN